MANSIYETILETMATQIQELGLTVNNASVPVAVRKLPKKEETLDTCPLIVVAPDDRPEEISPFSTEDEVLVKYRAEVVFIAAGDGDFTTTNLDTWLVFREKIRRLFQFGISGFVTTEPSDLFDAEVLPEAPLSRGELNRLYEYSGLGFRFWVVENRTN